MNISDLFKGLLKRGIRIGYSDGPAFDPSTQERTDAMEDIAKGIDKRKEQDNGNSKLVKDSVVK